MIRAAVGFAAALLATSCATDKVTLLENESGSDTGAVAVLAADGRESVIDRPLTEAALRDGAVKPTPVKAIKPAYATLLASLPPRARRFEITFPSNESAIPAAQRGVLEAIRNELATRPGAQIEVAGFTDSSGGDAENDALSLKRAQAVAEELRAYGFRVDPSDAVGRGEDEARNQLGDGKVSEAFRRVDVIVR